MKWVRRNWQILTVCASLLASGAWQVHVHLIEDFNRDEDIRVLKTLAVQEHPEYTLMLFPGSRP